MLQLKTYQQRALDVLADYLRLCRQLNNVSTAFYQITESVWGQGIPYRRVAELPGMPYICTRIPTGGGKTLVATYSVGVASKELLHADRAVVLWLVPSNAIREQTLNALRKRDHPYRQALEAAVGSVTVLDLAEALSVQPPTLKTDTVVVVSTMQAFRVEDTEGRKVYEASGALMDHFPPDLPPGAKVERHANGKPVYSLANVLRLHRPIVIVDEAHNARTVLSFETLARFDPSCTLEFTATPHTEGSPSNVLHSVSAAELKAEHMIKLPIRLENNSQWRSLVREAIGKLDELERIARDEETETGEYIRPIMLLQAQPKYRDRQSVTVDVVEACLRDDYHIPAEQIARATGADHDIEGVDLHDRTCKIRYIITVQALREGWDCPFAYVLCSVAEAHSATAVEQILGRVLRLPGAALKNHAALNMAYAFTASASFATAANSLRDALIQNGFERQEAQELIAQVEPPDLGPLFHYMVGGAQTIAVPADAAASVEVLPAALTGKVSYDTEHRVLVIAEPLSEYAYQTLRDHLPSAELQQAVAEAQQRLQDQAARKGNTPAERGEVFALPRLAVKQGELFEPLQTSHFAEAPWRLGECSAALSEAEFSVRTPDGQAIELDISQAGRIETRFLTDLQHQMGWLANDAAWTPADLVYWLDRNIPHPDIEAEESTLFLTRVVQGLTRDRGFRIDQLAREKYRLKDALADKIEQHRREAYRSAFNHLLFPASDSPVVVKPEICFQYDPDPMNYPASPHSLYRGSHRFRKHYYPAIGDLAPQGEEYECAQVIDALPEVAFWVRNLDKRPRSSLWLLTSSGRFYPDFVCKLKDGRFLIVEYKGAHLYTDAEEKRIIGDVWEKRSHGTCLFVMPTDRQYHTIQAKIRDHAL